MPTTCTAALVVHQRTGSQEEKVEAILKALAGSCIRTRAADGKGVRLWVNTDGGVSWKTDRP